MCEIDIEQLHHEVKHCDYQDQADWAMNVLYWLYEIADPKNIDKAKTANKAFILIKDYAHITGKRLAEFYDTYEDENDSQ
ncbi:MAG: hypothetical protein KC483_10805 [Nitrosarchaeum sp.]|nr:hypothetical protein [Nitrosarchaeum sp.]